MVNLVLSSIVVYHCCTLKLHKEVIDQIDKYRKHYFQRGSDLNAKQPPKATWPSVCLPKKEGSLGIINLSTHNDFLLMKFLHKFYSRVDIPQVHLVWDNYYANGHLPGQQNKGSFWWRDFVKLVTPFKSLPSVVVHDGFTILIWQDKWNGHRLQNEFPVLFSFARNPNATVKVILNYPHCQATFISPYPMKPIFNSQFFNP